ncbi:hypothetical protein AcV5_002269 [Taiwanofungus camphoratus]|nr:hypothetical protein AcV5_002269 [Antrodia cinnamomea]KAI0944156.1 hypothetical protein AcV7_002059 [Antrodia cinnamomea]
MNGDAALSASPSSRIHSRPHLRSPPASSPCTVTEMIDPWSDSDSTILGDQIEKASEGYERGIPVETSDTIIGSESTLSENNGFGTFDEATPCSIHDLSLQLFGNCECNLEGRSMLTGGNTTSGNNESSVPASTDSTDNETLSSDESDTDTLVNMPSTNRATELNWISELANWPPFCYSETTPVEGPLVSGAWSMNGLARDFEEVHETHTAMFSPHAAISPTEPAVSTKVTVSDPTIGSTMFFPRPHRKVDFPCIRGTHGDYAYHS